MKKILLLFLCLMLIIPLASCSKIISEGAEYEDERVIGSASEKPEVISELSKIISALTIDSIEMPEFKNPENVLSSSLDSVLNYLLTTNYSRFSGTTAVLEKAVKEYPNINISAAIGSDDLEGTLYSVFNHGGNIRHSDTERFRYLSKISGYIPAVQPQASTYSIDIVSIDETEHTYKMTFYCKREAEISPEYLAVFIKREKKPCYIYSLRQIASEKVRCNLPKTFS